MITGISGFGFFVQRWQFRDAYVFCSKNGFAAETLFLLYFGGARFFGQVVKKGTLWTPQNKTENLPDN